MMTMRDLTDHRKGDQNGHHGSDHDGNQNVNHDRDGTTMCVEQTTMVGWQEYLSALDSAVRRVEIELALHPGSFEPIPDPATFGEPEGSMPAELSEFAIALRNRMTALSFVVEHQMEELEQLRARGTGEPSSGYGDLHSVFIDTRV